MIRILFSFFLFYYATLTTKGQCVSVGPNNPTTSSNNAGIGSVAWGGIGNVFSSNDSRATAGALILGDDTNYLFSTGFNFAIPSTAVICGVSVRVERSATGFLQSVNDNSIRLIKEGVVVGSNHAIGTTWPTTTDNIATYGGTGDLWGTTWTPAEINSANFGVAISADLSGLSILPFARIDHVQITIHYDNSLPISLIDFAATCEDGPAKIYWSTMSELNNDYFTLERSRDGIHFEEIAEIDGTGNSSYRMDYVFEDTQPLPGIAYYRLKQTDHDGTTTTYQSVSTTCHTASMQIYPNPATDFVTVHFDRSENFNYALRLYNSTSDLITEIALTDENQIQLNRQDLPAGLYLIVLLRNGEPISTQRLIWK